MAAGAAIGAAGEGRVGEAPQSKSTAVAPATNNHHHFVCSFDEWLVVGAAIGTGRGWLAAKPALASKVLNLSIAVGAGRTMLPISVLGEDRWVRVGAVST